MGCVIVKRQQPYEFQQLSLTACCPITVQRTQHLSRRGCEEYAKVTSTFDHDTQETKSCRLCARDRMPGKAKEEAQGGVGEGRKGHVVGAMILDP